MKNIELLPAWALMCIAAGVLAPLACLWVAMERKASAAELRGEAEVEAPVVEWRDREAVLRAFDTEPERALQALESVVLNDATYAGLPGAYEKVLLGWKRTDDAVVNRWIKDIEEKYGEGTEESRVVIDALVNLAKQRMGAKELEAAPQR